MGSFNIQCFASKQVIAEHDKCRVAVIVQSSTFNPVKMTADGKEHTLYGVGNHVSGPDAFWKPKTAFLEATYSDFATVALADTPSNRCILAGLFTDLLRKTAVVEEGKNASHEAAFDFKALVARLAPTMSACFASLRHFLDDLQPQDLVFEEVLEVWKALEDAIFRNRVFVFDHTEAPRPLQLAVVHEAAFRGLVSTAEGTWVGSGLPYERKSYFGRILGELQTELAEIEDEGKRFVRKDRVREFFNLRMTECGAQTMLWPFWRQVQTSADTLFDKGGSVEGFLAENKVLLDSLYALKGMCILHLTFEPLSTIGQDYDNHTGQLFSAFVSFTARKVSAERQARHED